MTPTVPSGFGLGGNFECLIFVTPTVQSVMEWNVWNRAQNYVHGWEAI